MAFIYSSRDVQAAWSGVPLEGFTADGFISISLNEDRTSASTGGDARSEISVTPDDTGTVTISLQQGSNSNLVLSAALASPTLIIGDMTITDPSGSVFALCKDAHIMTTPEISLGIDSGDSTRDWVFWCEEVLFTSTPAGLPEGSAQAVSFVGSLV